MTITRALLALLVLGAAALQQPSAYGASPAPFSPQSARAAYEAIEARAPAAPLADEAGYRAIAKALEKPAPLTFGSFAPEAGGVVARDVTLSFGDTGAGLKLKELRLYGVDARALSASGALASPTTSLRIAQRIEARGVTSFGLEKWAKKMNASVYEAVAGATTDKGGAAAKEAEEAFRQASVIGAYSMSMERLVLDGFTLHGAEAKASPAGAAPGLPTLLKGYAAIGRMASADALIARNQKLEVKSGEKGAESAISYAVAMTALRGWRRGDIDESIASGLTWSMTAPIPAPEGQPAPPPMTMAGSADLYAISDLRLANLLSYWAAGETPPSREKALMSLGVWRSVNERYEMAGAPFYAIGESVTDLSHFEWLAPTKIAMRVENAVLDIGGMMAFTQSVAPANDPKTEEMKRTLAAFERHGFSRFEIPSSTADYVWTPKTGKAALTADALVKDFGRLDYRVDAGLPTFKALAALEPKKGEAVDPAALPRALGGSTLDALSFRIADAGALTRVFALMAELQSEEAGAPAGSLAPADLRAAAAMGMRGAAAASPFGAIMSAVGDFIADGGALTIAARPAPPIRFVDLPKAALDPDPVKRLGLAADQEAPR